MATTKKKKNSPAKNSAAKKSPAKKAPARRSSAPRAAAAKTARPRRARPESLRLASAAPSLTVNDVAKSEVFYRDVLGFTVKERWEEGGRLMGLMLLAGSVSFYVSQDDWKKGRDRAKGEGFRIYATTTQDVDELARRIQERGGTLDSEPKTMEWGRDFSLTDPDGFKISIVNESQRSTKK